MTDRGADDRVLTPAARQVLDRLGTRAQVITAASLWQAVTEPPGNLGSALLAALAMPQVPEVKLTAAALRERAQAGTEPGATPVIGCEHLVMGMLRHAEVTGAVPPGTAARARTALAGVIAGRAGQALLALRPGPGSRVPLAVAVTGLPGAGKSTLAEALATRLDADLFALDWQLGALAPFGLVRSDSGPALAAHLQDTALAHHLVRRRDLVLDATAVRAAARARWFALAERLGGTLIAVECVCPDERLHRERVTARRRGIPGWPGTVTWEHVQRTRELWEPWEQGRLVVDTREPLADCVERVLAHLPRAAAPAGNPD